MPTLANLRAELKSKANPKRAKLSARYFKTGKGEYGEGDVFLGLSSATTRPIAKRFNDLGFKDLRELLKSKIHEERQTALLILVDKYEKGREDGKSIFNFYLKNTRHINNWDLVDLSAPKIVGNYILDKDRKILYKLAKSKNLWERRIAILSTFAFIRRNQFTETLKISEMLLNDKHDLIHKAVGWMLRETGKQSQQVLEAFLKRNGSKMPRTMLRYSIEKLSESKRRKYLAI